MSYVVLPEIVLLETMRSALEFVRTDYENAIDKTKSYLYLLLNGSALDKYDLFEQAREVICGSEDSPRLLEIDLMLNMTRNHFPSVHITLPSEITGQGNGMGTDENYAEDFKRVGEDFSRAVFSRRLSATYNIVITSDNSNEVVLLYHFFRAMLIALIPHLHLKHLSNISFGGQDLQPYEGLGTNVYMRAITLSLQYDTFVPSIFPKELISDADAVGVPIV
jgi:hypothetical protein